MNPSAPVFSVIVVAFNSGETLPECVRALAQQQYREFQILIVDNGGENGDLNALDVADIPTTILTPGDNLGFAGGNLFLEGSGDVKPCVRGTNTSER